MAKNLIGCCSQDATKQYEHHIGTILANSRTVPSSSCLVAFKRMGSSTYAIFLYHHKKKFRTQIIRVEGGAGVLASFIGEELLDLHCVTISNKFLGSTGLATVGCMEDHKNCICICPLQAVTLGPDCVVFSLWIKKHSFNR